MAVSFDPIRLTALLNLVERPGFVKCGSDLTEPRDVPDSALADRQQGRYPYHTREFCYLSALEAQADGASPAVNATLKLAAEHYGIADEVQRGLEQLHQATRAIDVSELPDQSFLLVDKGLGLRKYAAVDSSTLTTAAEALWQNRGKYPLAMRKVAAARALVLRDRLGGNFAPAVDEWLQKAAGVALATSDSLYDLLDHRIAAYGRTADQETLTKLAGVQQVLGENPGLAQDQEFVDGVLEAIDAADRVTKLASAYGAAHVPLPEDALALTCGQIDKVAHELDNADVKLTNGRTVELASCTPEVLAAVDPTLTKVAAQRLPKVLASLPQGEADLLVRLVG